MTPNVDPCPVCGTSDKSAADCPVCWPLTSDQRARQSALAVNVAELLRWVIAGAEGDPPTMEMTEAEFFGQVCSLLAIITKAHRPPADEGGFWAFDVVDVSTSTEKAVNVEDQPRHLTLYARVLVAWMNGEPEAASDLWAAADPTARIGAAGLALRAAAQVLTSTST